MGRLDAGQTRIQVIETFERTPEALQAKVAHWYQDALGWNAPLAQLKFDPGVVFWSTLLAAGQTDNAVLARILSTNDYLAASGGTNEGFVTGLYQSLLGRSTDPDGLNYFVGLLRGGMSRGDLIQRLQTTVEAKRTKVAGWYHELPGLEPHAGPIPKRSRRSILGRVPRQRLRASPSPFPDCRPVGMIRLPGWGRVTLKEEP